MTGETVTATVSAWFDTANNYVGLATSDPASHRPHLIHPSLPYVVMIEGSQPNVIIRGEEADQAAAAAELASSFRSSYPEAEIVEVTDLGVLTKELQRLLGAQSTREPIDPHAPELDRLVILGSHFLTEIESEYPAVENFVLIGALGPKYRTATFFSPPDSRKIESILEGVRHRTVWALGELTWDAEAGIPHAGIEAALRGGVTTLAGIREVVAGAPMEWVRAFEAGRT